jgi:hypothetical protein
MMGHFPMNDLTDGEKMAFLTGLFVQGDLSSEEYLRQVRLAYPAEESVERVIAQITDWDFLNRILGRPRQASRATPS